MSATSLCATSQKTNEFICFLHSLHQYFCFSCWQNLWPPHVIHLLLSNLKPKPSWFTNSFTDQTAMDMSMTAMHVVDGRRLLSMVPTAAARIAASFLRSSIVPAPIPPIAASYLRSPIVPAPISPIAASFLRSPIVPAPIPPIELIIIPSQSPNRPRTHPFSRTAFVYNLHCWQHQSLHWLRQCPEYVMSEVFLQPPARLPSCYQPIPLQTHVVGCACRINSS